MPWFSSLGGQESWRQVEARFGEVMAARGHTVRPANYWEQQQHWDWLVDGSEKVEVKTAKRMRRHDQEPRWDGLLVELKGCQPQNVGWINGAADAIATQTRAGFLLLPRLALLDWLSPRVSESVELSGGDLHDYQLYRRECWELERWVWLPLASVLADLPHCEIAV